MKKFLLKILTVVISVAMILGTLASCGLFEINTDRDLKRAVATVCVDSEKLDSEDIYKRELVSGFMSYGYMYVQSYGYSVADTYELILDNLINNKIILQNAKIKLAEKDERSVADLDAILESINEFDNKALALLASQKEVDAFTAKNPGFTFGSDEYLKGLANEVLNTYKGKDLTAKDAAFRFVDEDVIWKAIADTKENVKVLIESFMDEEDEHEHEDVSYTTRTSPKMDEEEDEEISAEELEKYKNKKINLAGNERVNALSEAYDRLIELGLIDSSEEYPEVNEHSVLNLSYFKSAITAALETEMIEKFEELLRDEQKLTKDDAAVLWESYAQLQAAQKEQYTGDVTSLETALGAVSDSSFVVYNELTGYAYVSHLLIQYGDDLKAELDEAIADYKKANGSITTAKKNELVNEYAMKVTATDLRSSWVQAGYGVYENGKVRFTDDYVYTDWLATFDGNIERITAHTEENDEGENVLHFNYYGVTGNDVEGEGAGFAALAAKVIAGDENATALALNEVRTVVDYANTKKDAKNRFEDLKFAYSTDEGNFNNFLGYLYSPITSEGQYVKAFADACALVTDTSKNYGAGSYVMFGSYEYGLHIVLCTEVAADYLLYADEDAFTKDIETEGTVAYNFLEATNALLESNYISKLANKYVQDGKKDGCVTRYEKVYEDLLEE